MNWIMAVLLVLPLVAAQVPEAEWSLTVDAPMPTSVRPDTQTPLAWTVQVSAANIVCPQDATATLTWSIQDAADGVGAILEVPGNASVTIPQGQYVLEPFTGEVPVETTLLVSRYAEQGSTASFTATARLDLSSTQCNPEGPEPDAAANLSVAIEVVPEGETLYHPSHEEHADAVDAYIQAGQSYTHTFGEPESITYHDHLDPSRKGAIHVDQGANMTGEVTIDAQGYMPAVIRVAPGATVTWRNTDDRTHTVSFDELHGGEETEERSEAPSTTKPATTKGAPGSGVLALLAAVALALFVRR